MATKKTKNSKPNPKAGTGKTKKGQANIEKKNTREKKEWGLTPYILAITALFITFTFFFDDTGLIGTTIKPFLRGLFGGGAFVIPFYLIILSLFWKRDRANNMNGGKIILCIINFLFVMSLIHLLTTDSASRSFSQEGSYVKVFYDNGITLKGAGIIGGTVASGLEHLLGYVFTLVLSYIASLITLIFIFGSTPIRMIKRIINAFRDVKIVTDEPDPEPLKKQPAAIKKPEKPQKKKQLAVEDAVPISDNQTEKDPDPPVIPGYPDLPEEPPIAPQEEPYEDFKKIFEEKDTGVAPLAMENQQDEAEISIQQPAEPEPLVTEEAELIGEPQKNQYIFPPISLLSEGGGSSGAKSQDFAAMGQKLVDILASYKVKSTLISTSCGPTVTRYEIQPAEGVRVNDISKLADDIRLRLAAPNIRIETNISGKSAVGIEVPNENISLVMLRDLITNPIFRDNPSKLFVCLGMDVAGNPVYFDIPDMPHLLIAGATGMGKSVCINSLIISLLYRATPDELKFILIDPKKVELSCYNCLPHLLIPVVYEPLKAAGALNWAVVEMERRYTLMQEVGDARNLKEYNEIIEGDEEREKLPNIVIIIDELADLIMSAPSEVETSICRLAQKARAAGIYLIIGTQRPSVDVITGLIKANIPSRIAFTVSSQADSRTILNMAGAEKLLGRGDMLYAPVKALKPVRVQGTYIDGQREVAAVCNFIKNAAQVSYDENVIKQIEEEARQCGVKPSKRGRADGDSNEKEDPLFIDAIDVAFEFETISTSLLQRKLSVGYSRAQKMIDMMESRGYVGKFDPATKKRRINITYEEFLQLKTNQESGDA